MAHSLPEALQDLNDKQEAYKKALENGRVLKTTERATIATIAEFKGKISDLEKKLKDEEDPEARRRIFEEIEKLRKSIKNLEESLEKTRDELAIAPLLVRFAAEDLAKAAQELINQINQLAGH